MSCRCERLLIQNTIDFFTVLQSSHKIVFLNLPNILVNKITLYPHRKMPLLECIAALLFHVHAKRIPLLHKANRCARELKWRLCVILCIQGHDRLHILLRLIMPGTRHLLGLQALLIVADATVSATLAAALTTGLRFDFLFGRRLHLLLLLGRAFVAVLVALIVDVVAAVVMAEVLLALFHF